MLRNLRGRYIFWGFLFFFLTLVIVKSASRGIQATGDALGYFQLSRNMIAGNGFSRCDLPPFIPDSSRTPIYPLFIALHMILFGSAVAPVIVTFTQAVIASLTLMILNRTLEEFRQRGNGRFSSWAVILFGISPPFMALTLSLYSESLLLFFVAALLFVLGRFLNAADDKKALFYSLSMGVVLGLLTLTKPVGQFLPVVIGIILVLYKRSKFAVALVAAFIITISPWMLRNYLVFQNVDISTIDDYNLCEYAAKPLVEAGEYVQYKRKFGLENELEIPRVTPSHIGYFDHDHARRYRACGLAIISDHWGRYVKRVAANLADFPLGRGLNLATEIFNLESWTLKQLSIGEKVKDVRFFILIGGAIFDVVHRLVFYVLVGLGLYGAFSDKGGHSKLKSIAFFGISCYFIFIVAAVMINDFDLERLLLPAHLVLASFIPLGLSLAQVRYRGRLAGTSRGRSA